MKGGGVTSSNGEDQRGADVVPQTNCSFTEMQCINVQASSSAKWHSRVPHPCVEICQARMYPSISVSAKRGVQTAPVLLSIDAVKRAGLGAGRLTLRGLWTGISDSQGKVSTFTETILANTSEITIRVRSAGTTVLLLLFDWRDTVERTCDRVIPKLRTPRRNETENSAYGQAYGI